MKWDNIFPDVPEQFSERVRTTLKTKTREKNKKERFGIMKPKTFIAAVIAVVILGTITVGAATNGFGLLQSLFGEDAPVLDDIRNDVTFEILENEFEGVDFTVTGFHATDNAAMLIIDVISEEPMFSKKETEEMNERSLSGYFNCVFDVLSLNNLNGAAHYGHGRSFFVSENQITLIVYPYATVSVPAGGEYIFKIIEYPTEPITSEEDYERLTQNLREAKIKIIIDENDKTKTLNIATDIALDSGSNLNEIKISPFGIFFYYNGIEEIYDYNNWGADGSEFGSDYGVRFDAGVKYDVQIILKDGTVRDANVNDFNNYINFYFEETDIGTISVLLNFDKTIDVNEVEAVIYRGIEIPIA